MATCGVQSSVAWLTHAAFEASVDLDEADDPPLSSVGGAPCQGAPKQHDADERRDRFSVGTSFPSLVMMELLFVDCLPPPACAMAAPCELTDGPVDERP